mmetsp:Transcript_82914/g.268237  ORF Transcript_82914/g.268237 Transcript_82914/m.268237 type:complete len:207 (-) Transcript_82914:211-831(-)
MMRATSTAPSAGRSLLVWSAGSLPVARQLMTANATAPSAGLPSSASGVRWSSASHGWRRGRNCSVRTAGTSALAFPAGRSSARCATPGATTIARNVGRRRSACFAGGQLGRGRTRRRASSSVQSAGTGTRSAAAVARNWPPCRTRATSIAGRAGINTRCASGAASSLGNAGRKRAGCATATLAGYSESGNGCSRRSRASHSSSGTS